MGVDWRWICSFLFMEFKNADDASRALATMNGHPFDAKHTFLINRFTDFERYLNLDETYVEPPPEEYKPKERVDWVRISESMAKPRWVFDGRGVIDSREMVKLGVRVESVGRQHQF